MVRTPFGRDAKFALAGAYEVARELSDQDVMCEHLVIGLARAAPNLFEDGSPDEIEEATRVLLGRRPKARRSRRQATLRYDARVKEALQLAQEMTRRRQANVVDGVDLLRAITTSADDELVSILRAHDPTGMAKAEPRVPPPLLDDPGALIQLSDDSSTPFYDQITNQIKEAIAEGRLIPGERLPPVRRFADALDLAPGTVARAYRQLEGDGIVETDGARGTFVAPPRGKSSLEEEERLEVLAGLLRPTAVAAFHMGATAAELATALELAVRGVFSPDRVPGSS